MKYVIIGECNGKSEEIDEESTLVAAECLMLEYRFAFGPGWDWSIVEREQ